MHFQIQVRRKSTETEKCEELKAKTDIEECKRCKFGSGRKRYIRIRKPPDGPNQNAKKHFEQAQATVLTVKADAHTFIR